MSNIDWAVLGKVLGKIAVFFLSIALGTGLAVLAVVYLDKWSLLIVPICGLYFVIKHMYQDEMFRQGKRDHL